jgi:hypothetical protein
MQTMLVAERRDAHIQASLSTSTGLQFCGFPNDIINKPMRRCTFGVFFNTVFFFFRDFSY